MLSIPGLCRVALLKFLSVGLPNGTRMSVRLCCGSSRRLLRWINIEKKNICLYPLLRDSDATSHNTPTIGKKYFHEPPHHHRQYLRRMLYKFMSYSRCTNSWIPLKSVLWQDVAHRSNNHLLSSICWRKISTRQRMFILRWSFAKFMLSKWHLETLVVVMVTVRVKLIGRMQINGTDKFET